MLPPENVTKWIPQILDVWSRIEPRNPNLDAKFDDSGRHVELPDELEAQYGNPEKAYVDILFGIDQTFYEEKDYLPASLAIYLGSAEVIRKLPAHAYYPTTLLSLLDQAVLLGFEHYREASSLIFAIMVDIHENSTSEHSRMKASWSVDGHLKKFS